MQFREVWHKSPDIDIFSEQSPFNKVQTQPVKTDNFVFNDALIAQSGSFLAFIVFWGGIFIICTKKLKLLSENKLTEPMNDCANLPCIKCHYFARNHYLKCAVQPGIALTKEANNCADYHPKKEMSAND